MRNAWGYVIFGFIVAFELSEGAEESSTSKVSSDGPSKVQEPKKGAGAGVLGSYLANIGSESLANNADKIKPPPATITRRPRPQPPLNIGSTWNRNQNIGVGSGQGGNYGNSGGWNGQQQSANGQGQYVVRRRRRTTTLPPVRYPVGGDYYEPSQNQGQFQQQYRPQGGRPQEQGGSFQGPPPLTPEQFQQLQQSQRLPQNNLGQVPAYAPQRQPETQPQPSHPQVPLKTPSNVPILPSVPNPAGPPPKIHIPPEPPKPSSFPSHVKTEEQKLAYQYLLLLEQSQPAAAEEVTAPPTPPPPTTPIVHIIEIATTPDTEYYDYDPDDPTTTTTTQPTTKRRRRRRSTTPVPPPAYHPPPYYPPQQPYNPYAPPAYYPPPQNPPYAPPPQNPPYAPPPQNAAYPPPPQNPAYVPPAQNPAYASPPQAPPYSPPPQTPPYAPPAPLTPQQYQQLQQNPNYAPPPAAYPPPYYPPYNPPLQIPPTTILPLDEYDYIDRTTPAPTVNYTQLLEAQRFQQIKLLIALARLRNSTGNGEISTTEDPYISTPRLLVNPYVSPTRLTTTTDNPNDGVQDLANLFGSLAVGNLAGVVDGTLKFAGTGVFEDVNNHIACTVQKKCGDDNPEETTTPRPTLPSYIPHQQHPYPGQKPFGK